MRALDESKCTFFNLYGTQKFKVPARNTVAFKDLTFVPHSHKKFHGIRGEIKSTVCVINKRYKFMSPCLLTHTAAI